MLRKNRELKAIFLVLAMLFAAFLAVPAVRLLLKSFLGDDGLTGTFYTSVFTARNFTKALGNSFLVSVVSALLAVGVAFVFAYAIHYTRLPKGVKRGLQAVATLPMFLPTITYGFAIIYSFGKQGLITRLFGHQLFNIYGFGGLLVGYVIYTVPVAFLLIHNTMGYVDKKTLVVSKAMGDQCFATFWIAVLRPLLGTLAGAFIQAFFLCFTDFGIPASVGGKFDVIATVLYNEMLGGVPDFNRGAVVAVVMLLPSVLSILLLRWLEKYNIRYDRISQADLTTNPGRDTAWGVSGGVLSCRCSWCCLWCRWCRTGRIRRSLLWNISRRSLPTTNCRQSISIRWSWLCSRRRWGRWPPMARPSSRPEAPCRNGASRSLTPLPW